jgi:hypothetical protein
LLPFLFIFNTDLLLMDVTYLEGAFIFVIATAAMLLFTAGTQGFFLVRSRIWESAVLILVAFTLFRPGFWMDMISPPYESVAPAGIVEAMGKSAPGSEMRLIVEGLDDVGDKMTFTAVMPVGSEATGEERLEAFGLQLLVESDTVIVDNAVYDSPAQKAGLDFDQKILTVLVPADQPTKFMMFIPALLLLALVIMLQRRRAAVGAAA